MRTIDLQTFTAEVTEALNAAAQEESNEPLWTAALQLLGLLSPDNGLREASAADRIDSVAAYYDSEDKVDELPDHDAAMSEMMMTAMQ